MIKICHMTSVHRSDDPRIFWKECCSLATKENYQVYLVAAGTSREENGVKVFGIGAQPSSRLFRMLKVRKRIYKTALNLDADIYHFHDPELLNYGLKLKRKGKYVIFDSHENHPLQIREKQYIPKPFRNLIAKIYKIIENRVCKKIDGVIYPCLIKGHHPFDGRTEKLATIDNLPRLEELYNLYDENKIKKEKFTVCYVGSLSEARGITNIVDACYMAQVPLILAGIFSSKKYEKQLKSRKSFAQVDYRGKYNRKELKGFLEEASVGIGTLLPVGQYKNMSNLATKTYEYMSMALPVMLSDFLFERDMVKKYGFGIVVDPEDPKKMAKTILNMKNNPEECRKMGIKGREAVKEVFNWKTEEKKLFQFYKEICGE